MLKSGNADGKIGSVDIEVSLDEITDTIKILGINISHILDI